MFGILVVTHGEMATGLIDAMRMIFGQPEDKDAGAIEPVVLREGESPETLLKEIGTRIAQMKAQGVKGVLILTDLFGSTTTNAGLNVMLTKKGGKKDKKNEVAIVSGINLPMLLELVPALKSCKSVEELAEMAVNVGKRSIMNVAEEMVKRKKKKKKARKRGTA
jgi:mannose/fructose-specific phosphotransferase system component IIA